MNLTERIKKELKILIEGDYDRSMGIQEFSFVNDIPGWEVIQNGTDNFSFINQKYKINMVCTPCDNSSSYGGKGALSKQFPWQLTATVLGTNEEIPWSGSNGCNKNIEYTFNHYLKWFVGKDAEYAHKVSLKHNQQNHGQQ